MKDILVLCDASQNNRYRVDTAIKYGRLFESALIGIHMIPYPIIPVYGGIYPEPLSYSAAFQMESAEIHANQIKTNFSQSAQDAGLSYEWNVIDGLDLDAIIEIARYTDLMIAPAEYSHFGDQASHHLCNYLATHLGRPLLILPNKNKVYSTPKKVMIAWNQSHEAARAVHDAIPILKKADEIHILCVSKNYKHEDTNIKYAESLKNHLHHHDIKTDISVPSRISNSVGKTLQKSAKDSDTDLIVMGAYGQSRLKDIFLGGSTKFLIENSDIPLFTSN